MTDFVIPEPMVEPTARRVRAMAGGRTVARSDHAMLHIAYGPPIREDDPVPLLPGYFFPNADVDLGLLEPAGEDGIRRWWHLRVDDQLRPYAAWSYLDNTGPFAGLADHLTFRWHQLDAWFEEAERVYVHARDPHKRVDVLSSDRHVVINFDGLQLADSVHPFLLFETGLPTRYYLPPEDVAFELLEESDHATSCPYKGKARYWSVIGRGTAGQNLLWSYPEPIPEQPKLKGLVAFYNERLDIVVDDVLQPRPATPWSSPDA